MSPEPVALAVGGSLVAVASVRSALTRIGVRRQLRSALVAADPAARVAAVQTAGENGVGRNARLLLEIAESEEDIWVRQALAQTVMRHRWEPASTVALVRLRVWAKQELLWGRLEVPAGSLFEGEIAVSSAASVFEGLTAVPSAASVLEGGTAVPSAASVLEGGIPVSPAASVFEGEAPVSPGTSASLTSTGWWEE